MLMIVLSFYFAYGHVEFVAYPLLEALGHITFPFEGVIPMQAEFKSKYAKYHNSKMRATREYRIARFVFCVERLVDGTSHFSFFKGLNNIADFNIVELFKSHSALKAFGNFFYVVFKAFE